MWADRPGGDEPDSPGWRTRAVPNLYPALSGDFEKGGSGVAGSSGVEGASPAASGASTPLGDPVRASARGAGAELTALAPATGVHEVIVHGPEHRRSLSEFSADELGVVLSSWRTRIAAHAEDAAYVQLIVNEGGAAGASLEHSHAQLYALGFVPVAVARERERFNAHHHQTMGGDLLADIVSDEVRRRDRIVAIDDDAILFCPWASHSPFELRLAPRRAAPRFELDEATGASMLATAYRALTARFGACPPLNLWVRTAPRATEPFGWHIDIAPRLAIRAGFELSTGVDINIYPAERAASELRDALAG